MVCPELGFQLYCSILQLVFVEHEEHRTEFFESKGPSNFLFLLCVCVCVCV